MPTRWTKVKLAYDFLLKKNGQLVTAQEIANAANWKISSARSYITKL